MFTAFLTYFSVHYDPQNFSFEDFCNELGLDLKETQESGTEDHIFIGFHYDYVEDVNIMVRNSLKTLFGKEEILVKLKEKYNLTYKLQRVPTLFVNRRINVSLDRDIIEFLYKSQTIDNLDYFIDTREE